MIKGGIQGKSGPILSNLGVFHVVLRSIRVVSQSASCISSYFISSIFSALAVVPRPQKLPDRRVKFFERNVPPDDVPGNLA
jgi:hypothetical protein